MKHEILRDTAIAVVAAVLGYAIAVGVFFTGAWFLDAHDDDVFGQARKGAAQ